jgi:UDP-N-acetylmuramate dehydrogenase
MWKYWEPLARHTTFAIGGRAAMFARPRTLEELERALADVRREGLPLRILGGGSNLLVDDGDLQFAVITMRSLNLRPFRIDSGLVRSSGGMRLSALIKRCAKSGLGGLEPLAGIPGTVGGAVVGNAGAHGVTIGECVRSATVIDDDLTLRKLERSHLEFACRRSNLGGRTVVEVELGLIERDPARARMNFVKYREWKRSNHPLHKLSAGCVFKNPDGDSAGRLIDLCGLKGARVGGAVVSDQHANFIINRRDASARDVLELIDHVRDTVEGRYGTRLELEIQHWAA